LERAKVHNSEFGKTWNAFLDEGEPYFPRLRVEDDGEGVLFVEASESFPGEALALHFGEMLYQLRAALDSLIYEVAIRDSGEDPPPQAESLEFLLRPSQAAFDQAAWKIKPLSEQHKAMILSVQPYDVGKRGPGEQLVAETFKELNDLARKDRHRGLRVIAAWAANKEPYLILPSGVTEDWVVVTPDGLLHDEGEVARFKVSGLKSASELQANPNCSLDVAVEDAPPPVDDEDTMALRARKMIACVSEVIRGFEESFD
jgi:hypothetical protein